MGEKTHLIAVESIDHLLTVVFEWLDVGWVGEKTLNLVLLRVLFTNCCI